MSADAQRLVVADISYVADADKHGRALLAMWHRSDARIVARSPRSWVFAKPIVSEPVDAPASKPGWLRRLVDLLAGTHRSYQDSRTSRNASPVAGTPKISGC